jgi:glycolate oxidase
MRRPAGARADKVLYWNWRNPMTERRYNKVTETLAARLADICGREAVRTDPPTLGRYSRDQVVEDAYAHAPEVVVYPASADEVVRVLRLANEERVPVTPRGAGSGLSGGAVPVAGGILLSLERMNRVLEIDTENLAAVVEPGVVTRELDRQLAPRGLFFAGYPLSEEICHIGGNVAENAGGGRAIKYGVTGRYVIGLEVVGPTGELLRLGGKRVKDVTGYNLIGLLVGSEGTLGVITQVTLRLLPRPAHRAAALGFYPDGEVLERIGPRLLRHPTVRPSAVEFMDGECLDALRASGPPFADLPPAAGALLVEVDGIRADEVAREAEEVALLFREHGLQAVRRGSGEEELDTLWKVRKQLPWVLKRMSPYQTAEDIVVPVAQVWSLLREVRRLAVAYGVMMAGFGHLGDGNVHVHPIKPPALPAGEWLEFLPRLLTELYRRAADLGGTISGEHGIGHKRTRYLSIVLGEAEREAMRRIKEALDPNGILNPGKAI